ncbi:MAG TPA: GNAT family N-acetyltransferase [Caulobacteraceae bacterium]|nr:GNAT family N-acetyltransferase [Caulobacteraceae bacterium]
MSVQPIRLRPAGHEDARPVWIWRNDPVARAASHQTLPIPWDMHELWWKSSLGRADRILLIGEDAQGAAVGMVRFDVFNRSRWLVGIHVAPERRGQGWGRALLAAGLERMATRHGATRFAAEIKEDNAASRRLFVSCGFGRAEGDLVWTLDRPAAEAAA